MPPKNKNSHGLDITYVATIATMGDQQRLVIIPKNLHNEIRNFVGRQVKVNIQDLKL